MEFEPGKLYKTTKDIDFISENYFRIRNIKECSRGTIEKETILLCVKTRPDPSSIGNKETVFLYGNNLIVLTDRHIDRWPQDHFERAL